MSIAPYSEAGREIDGKLSGSAMTVAFDIDGLAFTALNDAIDRDIVLDSSTLNRKSSRPV